jgi:uncharacterized protein (TIGR03435 family)
MKESTTPLKAILICTLACTGMLILFVPSGHSQSPAQSEANLQAPDAKYASFVYDVASIKPHKGDDPGGARMLSDGIVAENIGLRSFVAAGYGVDNVSLYGVPAWLNSERFDIEFKMDPEVADEYKKLGLPERKLAQEHMFRVLFEDRLKLAAHIEMKEGPSYALVIMKTGLKLHRTADPTATGGTFSIGPGDGGAVVASAHAARIGQLVNYLTSRMGVPVIDQTGLAGLYDFTLKFASSRMVAAAQSAGDSAPVPETAPELSVAIQEQLGLKLESTKGPIKIVVIDHIERPSAN